MAHKIIIGGLVKPISHARCSKLRHASQKAVTFSRHHTNMPLGRYKSSKKKMHDEITKKTVKNGPKISVLIGVRIEMGRPHAIKNGNDIKDIKSCSWMLLSSDCCHCLSMFMILKYRICLKKLIKPLNL